MNEAWLHCMYSSCTCWYSQWTYRMILRSQNNLKPKIFPFIDIEAVQQNGFERDATNSSYCVMIASFFLSIQILECLKEVNEISPAFQYQNSFPVTSSMNPPFLKCVPARQVISPQLMPWLLSARLNHSRLQTLKFRTHNPRTSRFHWTGHWHSKCWPITSSYAHIRKLGMDIWKQTQPPPWEDWPR